LKSRIILVLENFDGVQMCPCSDTITTPDVCSGVQMCPCSDTITTPDVCSGVQIFLVLVVDVYDVLAIWFVSKVMKVGHDLQWPMSSVQPWSLFFQKVLVENSIRRATVIIGLP